MTDWGVKDAGVQKPASDTLIKVGGTYVPASEVLEKVNGSWQSVWSAGPDITMIDAMDSGLSAGWTGETSAFSADNSVYFEGSGSAVTDTAQSALDISSVPGDGLNAYFPKGTEMRVYVRSSDASHPYHCYYAHADGSNEVDILLHFSNNQIRVSTNHSTQGNDDQYINSHTLNGGDFYEIAVRRHDGTADGANDDHTVSVTNMATSSQVMSTTFNWPYLTANEGVRHWIGSASTALNLDYQHRRPL